LVNNPELILADEPTGNMDQATGAGIMRLFTEINREGHSIIMVTHDPGIAAHAGGILFLKDGAIVKQARNENGRRGETNAVKINK
jgi:ABC-type lipoprotein export system ATPase subunit